MSRSELIPFAERLLDDTAAVLVAVATGADSFKDPETEAHYRKLREDLSRTLTALGIQENPAHWRKLSDWYGYYRSKFETYKERRDFVSQHFEPTYSKLDRLKQGHALSDSGSPEQITWGVIESRIASLAAQIARNSDDLDAWQDTCRRSRELLVELSKLLSTMPEVRAIEGEFDQAANGKAWYERFLQACMSKKQRDKVKRLFDASWDMAQSGTHGTVSAVEGFAAAEAALLIVRLTQRAYVQSSFVGSTGQ